MKKITKNTLTTRAELDAELAQIRTQGFARDNEEREENLHCIGAPIFDYTGAVVAVLSVSWPSFRYELTEERGWIDREAAIVETLTSIARAGADVILTYWATEAAGLLPR